MAGFTALGRKGCAQVHLLAMLVVIDLYDVCGMALAAGLAIKVAGRCLRCCPAPGFRVQTAAAQAHEHEDQGSDDDLHMPAVFLWCNATVAGC